MAIYRWREHDIEVEFRTFAFSFWLMGGLVVKVDGRRFYPALDKIGLNTGTEFQVEDGGKSYAGVVQSLGPMLFLPRLTYVVRVDGEEVARDRQVLKRWYLSCAVGCLLLAVLPLALLGAAVVVAAIRQW